MASRAVPYVEPTTPTIDDEQEKSVRDISLDAAKFTALRLADRPRAYAIGRGPVTDAFLKFFRLRGKHRDSEALDDVATQPSVYDGPHAGFYQPRADWEVSLTKLDPSLIDQNIEAFDPSFRWTWREEKRAIRKVDWKVFTWIMLMFLVSPSFQT